MVLLPSPGEPSHCGYQSAASPYNPPEPWIPLGLGQITSSLNTAGFSAQGGETNCYNATGGYGYHQMYVYGFPAGEGWFSYPSVTYGLGYQGGCCGWTNQSAQMHLPTWVSNLTAEDLWSTVNYTFHPPSLSVSKYWDYSFDDFFTPTLPPNLNGSTYPGVELMVWFAYNNNYVSSPWSMPTLVNNTIQSEPWNVAYWCHGSNNGSSNEITFNYVYGGSGPYGLNSGTIGVNLTAILEDLGRRLPGASCWSLHQSFSSLYAYTFNLGSEEGNGAGTMIAYNWSDWSYCYRYVAGTPTPAGVGCDVLGAFAKATPTVGAAPLAVSFNGTAEGGTPGYTFTWRFGDGGSSALRNPSHTYATPGHYTAWLWVNDTAGHTATDVATVWVGPLSLTVAASASPTSLLLGASTTLTATASGGTGAYTYAWSTLPPGCSAGASATLLCRPNAAGHYNATVTVTDVATDQGTAEAEIDVYAWPAIVVDVSASPSSLALGGRSQLSAAASGGTGTGYGYAWTGLPPGCQSADLPTLTCGPTTAGHYNITATVTDSASNSGSGTAPLDVYAGPALAVTLAANPPGLALGSSTTITASATGGSGTYTSYAWSGLPPGCAGTTAVLTCTPRSAGHWNVSVTVDDSAGGVATSLPLELGVWTPVTLSVAISADPASLAVGSPLALSASVSGGTGTYGSYAWSSLPPGCPATSSATLSCAPSAAGHFNVSLTVKDSAGNEGSAVAEVDVYASASGASSGTSGGILGLGALGWVVVAVPVVVAGGLLGVLLRRRKRTETPRPPAPPAAP